jgi:hypothetical protein
MGKGTQVKLITELWRAFARYMTSESAEQNHVIAGEELWSN